MGKTPSGIRGGPAAPLRIQQKCRMPPLRILTVPVRGECPEWASHRPETSQIFSSYFCLVFFFLESSPWLLGAAEQESALSESVTWWTEKKHGRGSRGFSGRPLAPEAFVIEIRPRITEIVLRPRQHDAVNRVRQCLPRAWIHIGPGLRREPFSHRTGTPSVASLTSRCAASRTRFVPASTSGTGIRGRGWWEGNESKGRADNRQEKQRPRKTEPAQQLNT